MMHTRARQLPDRKTMYQALLDQDPSFEGVFYVGVRTTGIFCRPTCRAKKPKEENTEYFKNVELAMQHGYRACKICRPLERLDHTPRHIEALLQEIHEQPEQGISDKDLRSRSLDPLKIRRWFTRHYGMTFHQYLRSLRVNQANVRLLQGAAITHTAFDAGFESLSGFADAFKKITGVPPSHPSASRIITIQRMATPIGPMLIGATGNGICLVEFVDRKRMAQQISRLKALLGAQFLPGNNIHLSLLQGQLQAYFAGHRTQFDVPLVVPGTDFQTKAWQALRSIPFGTTRSYRDLAATIGNTKAVRAVATANGANRLAIVIPCHRIIGSDGKLVGYAGGIWRKKWLIDHERSVRHRSVTH